MLSVRNRDGSKGLGFGGEMEDTELEEGEACSYLGDDRTVDPDIALAYLDEKLQSVLGHFKKDFEGGVSAENLGAKFGGYGSFLPTYQRSPVCSHTRTPMAGNHMSRSPSNLQPEGGFLNNTTMTSASEPAHCSDISGEHTLSETKSLTTCDPLKLESGTERSQIEELTCRANTSKKSTVPDQRKLRFRIRVGSNNLPTQTKAELYSGLGLVASPSPSFEDNPESEGWSRKPHDAPDESPNSIIHTMTSLPLEGIRVLSPLSEDFAYLAGNRKSLKGRPEFSSRSQTRESLNLSSGPGSRNHGKSSVPKNKQSSTINGMAFEFGNGCTKHVGDINSKNLKKSGDQTFACDKIISEILELPLQSTSDGTVTDLPKSNANISDVVPGANKATLSFQLCKVRPSDMNHRDVWAAEKPISEVGLVSNLWGKDAENLVSETETQPKKLLSRRGGKNSESPFNEFNPSKVGKDVEKKQISYMLKTDMKEGHHVSEILIAAKDHSFSKAKSKSKVAVGHDITAEAVQGKASDASSSRSINVKRKSQVSMHVAENSKLHYNVRKSRDAYKDIFGDQRSEIEEKELQSMGFYSGRGPNDSQITDNGKITLKNTMKEEECSKKIDKPIISESHLKAGSYTSPPVNPVTPAAPAPPAAPVLIEDHWVYCDNCHKWRLLPVGRLPETLPDKWVCSMLDWLPGMNNCDIEEDETTKALVAFYQASASESIKSTLGHVDGSTYTPLPSGQTENLQTAVKSRSLNDVNYSRVVTNLGNSYQKQSSELGLEKNKKSSKDDVRLHQCSSVEGYMENEKIDKEKRVGQDFPRASKKHKIGYLTDQGKLSGNNQAALKNQGSGARSVSPFCVTSRDCIENTKVITNRNQVAEEINNSKTSIPKDQVSYYVDGSFEKRKGGPKDSSNKKRKAKDSQESRYSDSLASASLKDEERNRLLKEDPSQRFAKKAKKARVSSHLSDSNRESITERGYLAVPKKLKLTQGPDSILFKGTVENLEPSRRDSAPTHLVMEATSSSSNISSSHKRKAILQDIKGSPVKSVTSSPLRSRRNAGHTSNGRLVFDKGCPPNGCEHDVDVKRGSDGLVNNDDSKMGEDSVFPHEATKYSGGKSDRKYVSSEELLNNRTVTKAANTVPKLSDEAYTNSHILLNVSLPDKVGSSMQSKDKIRQSKSDSNKSDASNLFASSQGQTHTHGNKLMGEENIAASPQKLEKKHDMKIQSENGRDDARDDAQTEDDHMRFISGSGRRNEMYNTSVDASGGDDSLRELKTSRNANANNHNGFLPTMSTMLRHPSRTGHASNGLSASSPARRDSSSQSAATAVKEAKSLKHVADRLKNSGSNAESIGLYFQAALKFLLGASLLESSTSDTRQVDMIRSIQMYSSTAKLCEFCAREFEKAQDMASATLAYKCTEVAYMRVVYSSHSNANRDRHELQTALQMALPGESPSSSASDVDNINAVNGEKVPLAKGVSSPQLASSHVISARSRPSFTRLLNFAEDVIFAMEASRKSRSTLAAASAYLEKVQNEDGITLIKSALDYNFQDVEGLLQLVRLGVEAISR